MTLLEFAEKTSPVPLTAWQREGLIEYRCSNCNKLLGKFSNTSEFEIVCPRCKTVNRKKLTQK